MARVIDFFGLPETKPWLTVLHHPRRTLYLSQTMSDLDAAGAAQLANAGQLSRYIAVDGDVDLVSAPPGWGKISVGDGSQGIRRALRNLFSAAASAGAEHLLHFEDDVTACKNAVLALQVIPLHPLTGFLVACNNMRGRNTYRPYHPSLAIAAADYLLRGFWGGQALKIPGRTLAHLATVKISDQEQPNSGDVWIGQNAASRTAPWPHYGILVPSLFQHVGHNSLAWPGKVINAEIDRMADDFDPSFDALEISDLYVAKKVF